MFIRNVKWIKINQWKDCLIKYYKIKRVGWNNKFELKFRKEIFFTNKWEIKFIRIGKRTKICFSWSMSTI